MKILICDDDPAILAEITGLLEEINRERNLSFLIKSYGCGEDVLQDSEAYDIAFVDIEMPGINGLCVTRHLQNQNPNSIIFIVTSFQTYLDDAMDLHVFRYLSKPIDKARFVRNVNTALDIYQKSTRSIVAETYDECFHIFTRDILYVAIENRKACIVTKDRQILSKKNFDYWKRQLSEYDYFAQSHYSFLVNLKNVTHFGKTEVTVSADGMKDQTIPISRRFYSSFKEAFYRYIGATV